MLKRAGAAEAQQFRDKVLLLSFEKPEPDSLSTFQTLVCSTLPDAEFRKLTSGIGPIKRMKCRVLKVTI